MLELKHQVEQVIAMKTRGQLTAKTYLDQPELLAKAGVKPPVPRPEHNDYMVELYLNRETGQKTDNSHLISTSEQWLTESDLVMVQKERTLNLEFDWKRRLINPRMVAVRGVEHIAFDSQPWDTLEQGERARVLFDGWRVDNCLKTLDDWWSWEDHYESRLHAHPAGLKVSKDEGSVGILRRIFLRACTQGQWGLETTMNYRELAEWLTAGGYYTTPDACKNAKRAKLPEFAVPVTTRVLKLLAYIVREFPDVKLDKLFLPERLQEVEQRLAEILRSQNDDGALDK